MSSAPSRSVPFPYSFLHAYRYDDASSIEIDDNVPRSPLPRQSRRDKDERDDHHRAKRQYPGGNDDDDDDQDDPGRGKNLKKMDPNSPTKKKKKARRRHGTVTPSKTVPTKTRHDDDDDDDDAAMAPPKLNVDTSTVAGNTLVSSTTVASTATRESFASSTTDTITDSTPTSSAVTIVSSFPVSTKTTVAGTTPKIATGCTAAGFPSTVASKKKPSHQTTKIWTQFHQIVTNDQEPLVAWSDDGMSMIISDWKEFTQRKLHKHMFGYSQAISFNRAFERCHFRREKFNVGKTTTVRLTHTHFVRDDPNLVRHILSDRGDYVNKHKYDSHFKPCKCKGCHLRGED